MEVMIGSSSASHESLFAVVPLHPSILKRATVARTHVMVCQPLGVGLFVPCSTWLIVQNMWLDEVVGRGLEYDGLS